MKSFLTKINISSKAKKMIGTSFAMSLLAGGVMCQNAFAAETSVASTMTTAFTAVKTDTLEAISAIAPIALSIVGVFLVWKYGVRFFKGMSK